MGQGYSLTTVSAGSAGIETPELSDLAHEIALGNARFLKTIRARHKDGLVVAKVVMKPYATMKFDEYIRKIVDERELLKGIPNTLSYARVFETATNGYLVRQYMYSSLYDRLSTRPFLENIEKRWLAFQLLCAVRDCHAANIYHGDIKTENVLVTSWGWLYLTDFSSAFKPTYLPEDNPADFSFFFDISGRRTCYIAPERFLGPGETADGRGGVTWAMDIFSVGCVIAELFLEGPIFTLSQLFKYRQGELDPQSTNLNRIEDEEIREMISHMVQVEPETRYSADEYLNFWRNRAFPDYFYGFLHQYMQVITDPMLGRGPLTAGKENLGESDDRIDRVYFDYDKISYLLGHDDESKGIVSGSNSRGSLHSLLPLHLDLPNKDLLADSGRHPNGDDGTVLFLNIITACVRSTARASSKARACELLLAFSRHISDESRMDRVLPFLADMLTENANTVKVAALRSLTQLLATIKTASPTNAFLFRQYVLPRLDAFRITLNHDSTALDGLPDSSVKIAFASCLAHLATSAAHFLDIIQALKADGLLPRTDYEFEGRTFEDLYDPVRAELVKAFEAHTKTLLTEDDAEVRKAFMGSISELCIFFGSARAHDLLLSHMLTYLNDSDWRLRYAFFDAIQGLAVYIGATNFEEFVLPVLLQSLIDPEEMVIVKIVRSLSCMIEMGLVQRSTMWTVMDITSRFLVHPNEWIREATAGLHVNMIQQVSQAEFHCTALQLLQPYLKIVPSELTQNSLLINLKAPLPRHILDALCTWAVRDSDTSKFWKPQKASTASKSGFGLSHISSRDLGSHTLSKLAKSADDQQWISRLRHAGMDSNDEMKILALRDYVWRLVQKRADVQEDTRVSQLKAMISLKDIDIQPEVVLFDPDKDHLQALQAMLIEEQKGTEGRQTITDALLDASTHLNSAGSTERTKSPAPAGQDTPRSNASSVSTAQRIQGSNRQQLLKLMQGQASHSKATAEIGTSPTNAHGSVDGSHSTSQQTPVMRTGTGSAQTRAEEVLLKGMHSYRGRDPSVLTLLGAMSRDTYASEVIEFGPTVVPVERRQWPTKSSVLRWKPDGMLVALLGEHTDAVTRIAVAPDHAFFITGSADGVVKVWDTARLERNLSHFSRQTYRHASRAAITHLSFIGNTHTFVTAAADGTVHLVKVDCTEISENNYRYGKLRTVREYRLMDDDEPAGHAVWTEYYKSGNQPVLLVATSACRVHALDLRTMDTLYTLKNPRGHGTPTSFCTDKARHWLLLGTQNGILDFWDLRFRLRLRSWIFNAHLPIHRISPHPAKQRASKLVMIAGGTGPGEVSVWDVEKGIVREVYRAASNAAARRATNSPADPVDDTSYTTSNPDTGDLLSEFHKSNRNVNPASQTGLSAADWTVRAFAVSIRQTDQSKEGRYGYFIAGGGLDRKVRFWNMDRVEASCVVSGLEAGELQPSYRASVVGGQGDTTLVEERSGGFATDAKANGRRDHGSKGVPAATAARSRSSVVNLQQQVLLKSHLDSITDVALLEFPMNLVISADRSGVIYVFS